MLWVVLSLLSLVRADFAMENGIVGEPTIDCEDSLVGLTFKSKKPFTGRVYVQGLSDDDRCAKAFVDNRNMSRMSMEVKTGDCTMQRHRVTGKLEGLMFSVTIVVSFHGTFVTKADRAFRCICFFRNQKTLTNSIQIGSLGTTELLNPMAPPSCTYEIRSSSPEGPLVVEGKIGDKIFHVWKCDAPGKGFLIHSCKVTDGRGFTFELLDVDGCAVDPSIQPDLTYNEEASTAIAETYGYKFSDTNVLNYECIVEICSKTMGECQDMTPPVCDKNEGDMMKRVLKKRSTVMKMPEAGTVEVAASISMMDNMKEAVLGDDSLPFEAIPSGAQESSKLPPGYVLCLTTTTLTITTSILTILLLGIITLSYFISRVHKYYFNHNKKVMFNPPIDEKEGEANVSHVSVASATI